MALVVRKKLMSSFSSLLGSKSSRMRIRLQQHSYRMGPFPLESTQDQCSGTREGLRIHGASYAIPKASITASRSWASVRNQSLIGSSVTVGERAGEKRATTA